jgi:hypothetical protein
MGTGYHLDHPVAREDALDLHPTQLRTQGT